MSPSPSHRGIGRRADPEGVSGHAAVDAGGGGLGHQDAPDGAAGEASRLHVSAAAHSPEQRPVPPAPARSSHAVSGFTVSPARHITTFSPSWVGHAAPDGEASRAVRFDGEVLDVEDSGAPLGRGRRGARGRLRVQRGEDSGVRPDRRGESLGLPASRRLAGRRDLPFVVQEHAARRPSDAAFGAGLVDVVRDPPPQLPGRAASGWLILAVGGLASLWGPRPGRPCLSPW